MKKKRRNLIIAAAAVLLVLAVPFSTKLYKDGGTRVYTALTYKIVDFNKLTENGEIYEATKIYPFPMNFMSDDFIMASANGSNVDEKDGSSESFSDKLKALISGESENAAYTDGGDETVKAPPSMEITYGEGKTVTADADTFCWTYIDSSGKTEGICVDALHPLDGREFMKEFTASTDKVKISFAIEPESVEVRCWPDSCLNKSDSPYESVQVTDGEFALKKGGYIYQVIGVWNSDDIINSNASYCFYGVLS